jgi:hypothetical protein
MHQGDALKPTQQQPRPGHVVLYCAHMVDGEGNYDMKEGSHWFGMRANFQAPDGSRHFARWFNCCEMCFLNLGGDPMRLLTHTPIGGHHVWKGRKPVIADTLS